MDIQKVIHDNPFSATSVEDHALTLGSHARSYDAAADVRAVPPGQRHEMRQHFRYFTDRVLQHPDKCSFILQTLRPYEENHRFIEYAIDSVSHTSERLEPESYSEKAFIRRLTRLAGGNVDKAPHPFKDRAQPSSCLSSVFTGIVDAMEGIVQFVGLSGHAAYTTKFPRWDSSASDIGYALIHASAQVDNILRTAMIHRLTDLAYERAGIRAAPVVPSPVVEKTQSHGPVGTPQPSRSPA